MFPLGRRLVRPHLVFAQGKKWVRVNYTRRARKERNVGKVESNESLFTPSQINARVPCVLM